MKLTGSQVFAKELKSLGIHYVAGIPGQGSWALVDALLAPDTQTPFIQVMQEQSAVYMADGYFRACGRPMAALLPTPLHRSKALGGIEAARVDGSAVLVVSGAAPGPALPVLFEVPPERSGSSALKAGKARLSVTAIDKLAITLRKGFDTMMSGFTGPVIVDIAQRVQADSLEVKGSAGRRRTTIVESMSVDPDVLEQISALLAQAHRPVILVGAGVVAAEAGPQLLSLAETWLAPVITTSQAKGAFAEDHPLSGATLGRQPLDCANALLTGADLVVAIGCAVDSEIMPAFSDAPLKAVSAALLIIIDSDTPPHASSRLAEVSVCGPLKELLSQLSPVLSGPERKALRQRRGPYLKTAAALHNAWDAGLSGIEASPLQARQPLRELRVLLERDAILVVGAGSLQTVVRQVFPVYTPRSHLCASLGGAAGWAVPAAIGAKLAMPARQVVCVVGDGDFLQSMQEMAVCMMHTIPVVFVVLNNSGYASLSELHQERHENHLGGEFNLPDGKPYSPDFAVIARSFGLEAWRVEHGSQLKAVLSKAINSKGPSLVEVITARGNLNKREVQ